jgi:undecaprenyl-phosphate 4-deoxy-4-formamido-L-arabinose transferase
LSVSVIIPCYRSAKTLPILVARLVSVLHENASQYEVLLVVDGSPDDTWEVAAGLAYQNDSVGAIRLSRNYGQHNALMAGIRQANFDILVTMDDDLQHPPEEIPALLEALEDGEVDLVYGVPYEEEHGFFRSLASRSVKAGMSVVLGVRHARIISSFRAFRTRLHDGFERLSGPYASLDISLSWVTTRVGAVTVQMSERRNGKSNYTVLLLVRHAINMVLGCSATPLRMASYVGSLTGFVGLFLGGVVIWHFIVGNTTVAGFTTIASMVCFFSSVQLISIGIVGEYIGRIHGVGMGRPPYVIYECVGTPVCATTSRRPVLSAASASSGEN